MTARPWKVCSVHAGRASIMGSYRSGENALRGLQRYRASFDETVTLRPIPLVILDPNGREFARLPERS